MSRPWCRTSIVVIRWNAKGYRPDAQKNAKLSEVAIKKRMQSFLVSHRKFEELFIARDHKHLPYAVEQHRAAPAVREMPFDLPAEFAVHIALDIR
jgi:hypothetical protein